MRKICWVLLPKVASIGRTRVWFCVIPKVLTNCSASALMAFNAEGLVVANAAGLELDVAHEAIAILSGTSLSHVK